MTPNPNSPAFIKHEVPEYACERAKTIAEAYSKLQKDARNGKWKGITEDDISIEYNTYDGSTKVEAKLIDNNTHTHHFIIQLLPDNGFGDGSDTLYLKYLFEGAFDENVLSVRSFADYLAIYLEWEGFEPTLTHCSKVIEMPGYINYIYEEFCKLLDTTISKLRPIEWFYSKELQVDSIVDVYDHFYKVLILLKAEAKNGRWKDILPDCFKFKKYEDCDECCIYLNYKVDNVWEWLIHIDAVWYETYADLSLGISYISCQNLSDKMRKELDKLFADFLLSLQSSNGNLYMGCGNGEHCLNIQYFHIEDSFDLFCNLIDDITAHLNTFNLQIDEPSVNLTGEIGNIIKQLEDKLQTNLSIVTEEHEINEKLKNGYFVV